MKKKRKDTDYLYLSARIRCLERRLLTRGRMEQMLEAPDISEAVRILNELGYESFNPDSEASLHQSLLQEREKLFSEMEGYAESREIVDVFRLKYDYHNVKILLKDQDNSNRRLLLDTGRMKAAVLEEKYRESGHWDFLPKTLAAAANEAERVLYETGDPQKSDFILDRAYYAEMRALAEQSQCDYLQRYVAVQIDAANLRAAVRAERMHKNGAFLQQVLFEGGMVPPQRLLENVHNGVAPLYRSTPLREAAEEGDRAISGGSLTNFERLCDDAVMHQVAAARNVPFGVEVVIGYLAAKEAELTAVRIIVAGRMAGLQNDVIRERLRESYV